MTAAALMRWGAGLAAAGLAGIALATDYHGIVTAFALTSLGYGFARPGFTAGASLMVGEDEQGAVAGAVTAINGACFVLAPAAGIGLYGIGGAVPLSARRGGRRLLLAMHCSTRCCAALGAAPSRPTTCISRLAQRAAIGLNAAKEDPWGR